MKLLKAEDQYGVVHYGATIELTDGTVWIPLNKDNTPESLEARNKRYLSGEIDLKKCMTLRDIIPKSLR